MDSSVVNAVVVGNWFSQRFTGSLVNLLLAGAIAVFVINLCSTGLGRNALR